MSDNTRNFYGRSAGQVEERYLATVFGAFRAAVEEHLPVTVINDWNLTADDLAKYKVLILPNTACLDDAQVAAIERVRPQRRRAGREPRHVAVRRVRRRRARTSRWRRCSASTTAVCPDDGRAAKDDDRRQLREVDRPGLLGEAQERLRLPAGRRRRS